MFAVALYSHDPNLLGVKNPDTMWVGIVLYMLYIATYLALLVIREQEPPPPTETIKRDVTQLVSKLGGLTDAH
jgi:hypothetical protein